MKLNEKQIKENWEDLLGRIEHQFNGERKDSLLEMYKYFADRMMFLLSVKPMMEIFDGKYILILFNIIFDVIFLFIFYRK